MADIHTLCGHNPVVFYSSFQNPSLYRYFTGENASALGSLYNRQTQYDILQLDKAWQGKEVFVVSPHDFPQASKMDPYDLYYREIQHFQGTNRIEIEIENQQIEDDTVVLDVNFKNHYAENFVFAHPEYPVQVYVAYIKGDDFVLELCDDIGIQEIPANSSVPARLCFPMHPGMPMVICLSNQMNLSVNSAVVKNL